MFNYVYLSPVLFLILLSIIDIKTFHLKKGFIPSIITTTAILISFILCQNALTIIFSFILGFLLFDLDLFEGEPDLKIFTACGAVLPSILYIVYFAALTSFLAIVYKSFMKKAKFKEIPFIPVLLISYIGTITVIIAGFL